VKRKRRFMRRFCWCSGLPSSLARQQDIKQKVDYQVHDLSQKENDTDEDAERRVDQESTGHECSGD